MLDANFPSAKIICHSKAPNGEELITFELEFHRFILSELNTHRSFSRNAQSSRAVPIEKMIEQVRNNPAMPVHWGKNQAGMVAEKELDELVYDDKGNGFLVEGWWRSAAKSAANYAEAMSKAGYHKQIVNRILEPFMKTKGVVTATKDAYEAFFKLRCHKDAQPEIKLLAERMQKALNESIPNELKYGEYHLPYVNHSDFPPSEYGLKKHRTDAKVKVSCSCTAQVSYRRLDDSLDKALKVYSMLNLPVNGVYPEDPPHYSPTEHVAKVMEDYKHESFMSGNFHSGTFWQYRKALEMGLEDKFLEE
jgi:thymidylate synthase ThyX